MLQVFGNQWQIQFWIKDHSRDTLNSHTNDINLKFSSSIVSLILMTKRKEGKASNTQQWYMLFSLDDTLVACSRGELRFWLLNNRSFKTVAARNSTTNQR